MYNLIVEDITFRSPVRNCSFRLLSYRCSPHYYMNFCNFPT